MAQVALTGRLSQDVTTRFLPDGRPVATFSLAESMYVGKGKAKDGKDYGTEWWQVTVWGPQAGTLAERIEKGDLVTVFGETQCREYQDKEGNWQTAKGSKMTASSVVPHVRKQVQQAPVEDEGDELADLLK